MCTRKAVHLFILMTAVLLSGLACNLPFPAADSGSTAVKPPTEASPAAGQTAAPAVPTQTTAPTQATAPDVSGEGITFSLFGLAAGATYEVIPATPYEADMPNFALNPEYVTFTLQGYSPSETFHTPVIMVYPVAEYAELVPDIAGEAALLAQVATDPAVTKPEFGYPFLPIWGAAQVYAAQATPVAFASGTGIRYVTQYSQALTNANNREMFYTFQGLTADGRYWVAAVLPVAAAGFPENSDALYNRADLDAYLESGQFETDFDADIMRLQGLASSDFTPPLESLDALV
ncbi:MAG: hypothetical protein IT326_05855, partial [Anaerolineae bacterium]|nr:hypothetical protein [Anaerolineae bacterium]